MIVLKVKKKQSLTLISGDTFLENLHGVRESQMDHSSAASGLRNTILDN